MSKNFVDLYDSELKNFKFYPGAMISAKILEIDSSNVILNSNLKSESYVPIQQFFNEHGELEVQVGDEVEVVIEALEDGLGQTRLSRDRAKKQKSWSQLINAYEEGTNVVGLVTAKVKGGYMVEIGAVKAFLPGSLLDLKFKETNVNLEGKELEFKVVKVDQKRNNVVVSRRMVLSAESQAVRDSLLGSLQEGQEVVGVVKNVTDYGAFIDLGGVDGLLHITDMAWKRVKHPSELIQVGQELSLKILKFDRERNRVSLGLKQLCDDPWVNIASKYIEGMKLTGKVTNVTEYGCFVELEHGVEGLVHVSEMDWTNKNIHPSKVVSLGAEVEVMVLEVDQERRRISLGLKQCKENPWVSFAETHEKGQKITGKIKSITDFGIFIGLPGNIDGLIHLSDLSWNDSGEQVVRQYKKGQEIEAVILSIDHERERISLGIKQLEQDSFSVYVSEHAKGSIVSGEVIRIEEKAVIVQLAENLEGILKATDISKNKVDDLHSCFSIGNIVEAKIVSIDRKSRVIFLSIKAKDSEEEKEALREINSNKDNTTLGDVFKQ